MISLAALRLDNPLSISSKVNLATELWKAATASCVGMGFLPLSPTTLMEDLPTNLVVHLVADLPRLLIALGLLNHRGQLHENRSGLNGFRNNILLVTRLLCGDC